MRQELMVGLNGDAGSFVVPSGRRIHVLCVLFDDEALAALGAV